MWFSSQIKELKEAKALAEDMYVTVNLHFDSIQLIRLVLRVEQL